MIRIDHQLISTIPVLEIVREGNEKKALPTLFFYHGWESRKERVLEYGYVAAMKGFRVVLPEAKGHGERKDEFDKENNPLNFWDVVTNNLKEFPMLVEHYQKASKIDEHKIFVGGTSMGGITTHALLTQYDWIYSAAVLMGSPSPIAYSNWLLEKYLVDGKPMIDLLDHEKVEAMLKKLEPISLHLQPEKINSRPIYIWHGTDDPTVPFHLTKNFVEEIKDESYSQNVTFEQTEGVGHEVPQKMIHRMIDFFALQLDK